MRYILIAVVLSVVFLFADKTEIKVSASNPGATVSPLLSCPNVDGSADNKILVADILAIVQAYFNDYPAADYVYMYDLANPYNPETGTGGTQRVDDILTVVGKYFDVCPTVDTQVAQATRWVLMQHPEVLTESGAVSAGYICGGGELPGQGRHCNKASLWDDNFDPTEPEGLVYRGGRLVAQFHVVGGPAIGWLEDPGPQQGACWDGIDNGGDGQTDASDVDCGAGPPSGPPLSDIDIDPLCPPQLVPCSWSLDEGWHLHYNFCTIHIGTPYQILVSAPNEHQCQKYHDANPKFGGTWQYAPRLGWMGHLFNWLPNANRIPDVNGTMNGRFADCSPDVEGWKAYNCPQ